MKRFRKGCARLKIRLTRAIVKLFSYFVKAINNKKIKLVFSKFVLKFQNSLPIELAANKGEVVIQIGTPRVRTVQRLLKAVGSKGSVIILEPEPNNYAKLVKSPLLADVENLKVINAAAWSETIIGELTVSQAHMGDHKISIDGMRVDNDTRAGNENMQKVQVQFYALDDLLGELEIGFVDYLSVTVNGAELEVLKGVKRFLKSKKIERIYSKGHCIDSDNKPIMYSIKEYLDSFGYDSMYTKGEMSTSTENDWGMRSGDVFAIR